jgi:hypothetical protein
VEAYAEGPCRAALDLQQRRRVEGGRDGQGFVAPAGKPALLAQAQNDVADGAAAALEGVERAGDLHALVAHREHGGKTV